MKEKKIVLLLFLFVSCVGNEPRTVVNKGVFPISINAETKEVAEIEVICPDEIIVHNGYLIILNNCHEKILQVVHLDDLKNKFFINKGHGPSEFFSAYYSGQKTGDSILLVNTPAFYSWVDPGKLYNGTEMEVKKNHALYMPPQNMNVFLVNENWIFNDMEGSGFLVSYDQKGSLRYLTEFFPKSTYATEVNRGYVYYAWSRYNKNKEIVVSALRYFPYIIFTDIEGQIKKVVQTRERFKEPVFPNEALLPEDGTEIFNLGIQVSDKYVYLYNPGLKAGESELNANPIIEVYNWEGDPVAEIKLNALVGTVDYDFASGRAFGLKFSAEELKLSVAEIFIPEEFANLFKED